MQQSFREFVSDLFPNPVVDKQLIDTIEKDLAFDPILNTFSPEIITLLSEIKAEFDKETPRTSIIYQDKYLLSLALDMPPEFQMKCFEEYHQA